jgi:hypothetical protein
LWVYASDIESVELPAGDPPALLPVADSRGLLLGTALYSPASQIALRLVSREAIDEAAWLELLEPGCARRLPGASRCSTSRTTPAGLCFSEADELPGLVADKYGDLVILQLLAKGLDSAAVRETCVRVLREELAPAAILERPDPRMRELEGLAAPSPEPLCCEPQRPQPSAPIPAQRPALSLRRQLRAEDRRLPRPAGQLRRRAEWAQRLGWQIATGAAARWTSAATRAALPASGRGLRAR